MTIVPPYISAFSIPIITDTSALIIIIRFRVFDKPWIHLHFLHINQNYQGLLKNIIIKTY